MDAGVITGGIGIAVSVLTLIYGAINHKRLRSNCCGKESVVSIDIESTTPPIKKDDPKVECSEAK